jgi:hypothetical protein
VKKQSLPRGFMANLLSAAGFTSGIPLVDPPSGSTFAISGTRRGWLNATKNTEKDGLLDYHRAANCMASRCVKNVEGVLAAAFIEGFFYVQYEGENQIERWVPTKATKELRNSFDRGETPPTMFTLEFGSVEGKRRYIYRRKTDNAYRRKNGKVNTGTGLSVSQRRPPRVLNHEIRNGILIAERISS